MRGLACDGGTTFDSRTISRMLISELPRNGFWSVAIS
jgi:hypothetical protein